MQIRFAAVQAKAYLLSAAAGFGVIAFILGVATILEWFGIKIGSAPDPAFLPRVIRDLPLALLTTAVLAPLFEELVFRGLMFDWLRQKVPTWAAVPILSLIFALLHDNGFKSGVIGWLAFSDRFLMAIIASILTIKYRSLRASSVMHATINSVVCITSLFS